MVVEGELIGLKIAQIAKIADDLESYSLENLALDTAQYPDLAPCVNQFDTLPKPAKTRF